MRPATILPTVSCSAAEKSNCCASCGLTSSGLTSRRRGDAAPTLTARGGAVVFIQLLQPSEFRLHLLHHVGVGGVVVDTVHFLRVLLQIEQFPLADLIEVDQLCNARFARRSAGRRCGRRGIRSSGNRTFLRQSLGVLPDEHVGDQRCGHVDRQVFLTPAISQNVAAKIDRAGNELSALVATRLHRAGPAHEKWRAERLFVHPTLVVPAMLAQVKALVRASR